MKKPDTDRILRIIEAIERRFPIRAYPLYDNFDDLWMVAMTDQKLLWSDEFNDFASGNDALSPDPDFLPIVTEELPHLEENYRKYGHKFFDIDFGRKSEITLFTGQPTISWESIPTVTYLSMDEFELHYSAEKIILSSEVLKWKIREELGKPEDRPVAALALQYEHQLKLTHSFFKMAEPIELSSDFSQVSQPWSRVRGVDYAEQPVAA